MTDEELAEIRARCEAATHGPWRRTGSFPGCGIEAPEWVGAAIVAFGDSDYEAGNYKADYHPGPPFGVNTEADAEFCAHARSDIPNLLAEIERRFTEAEVRDLLKLVDWDGYRRQELEAALTAKRRR